MRISFEQLRSEFERVLLKLNLPKDKAQRCADIFASNSRDGIYSHGLNRFPVFAGLLRDGHIDPAADATCEHALGQLEIWNGNNGPGMYNATVAMDRAIALAKTGGIGCVAIGNNNHWMRGGTYGWQAAEAGCIGICFTNASAGIPPWGGVFPALGNNPLVIAVPRQEGHIVLDMAMSQYSYGKLQEYQLNGKELPYPGGYDKDGALTSDPAAITESKRALPIGFWKGSGLALVLDIVLTSLTGGNSTARIQDKGHEVGLSQCFIAIHREEYHAPLIDEILTFTRSAGNEKATFPGENTVKRRIENLRDGIPVQPEIWEALLKL